jgi:hypothetical protein
MGPKKGKSAKKGMPKKKAPAETAEEGHLKKAQYEIEALKDNLAFRKEFSRRAKAAYEEMKGRIDGKSSEVEDAESMHKSANAYLTHQYKSLQTDMGSKLHNLEADLVCVRKQYEDTSNALNMANIERKRITVEKDERINELQLKVQNLEIAYDSIIHLNLNRFIEDLNKAKAQWETIGASIQVRNKRLLAELGLNSHDI